jgi:hypothetical protein
MKTIYIVSNKEVRSQVDKLLVKPSKITGQTFIEIASVDCPDFNTRREANAVMNKYAVTKLPFVLLIDRDLPEDKQEYAAVYSEEGPITVDRINTKL